MGKSVDPLPTPARAPLPQRTTKPCSFLDLPRLLQQRSVKLYKPSDAKDWGAAPGPIRLPGRQAPTTFLLALRWKDSTFCVKGQRTSVTNTVPYLPSEAPRLLGAGFLTCPSRLSSSFCTASATCSNRSLLLLNTWVPSLPMRDPTCMEICSISILVCHMNLRTIN